MDPFTALKILFYVGSGVASYKSYKKAKKLEKQANQLLIQKYGTGGGIPVSYGTRRVAGTVLYANTINNRELFVVYAISVGEIHNISNIKIGGRSVADTSVFDHFIQRNTNYFGSTQAELDRILANQDPPNKPRMVFNCHMGAADQVADPMLVGCVPEWTSAHRLKGIAYIACNFDYDSGGGMFTGLPEITCDVQGKKIYDPRLDSTVTNGSGSQRINDPSTFAFTNNTPLVLLDYLTNSEYGKALPTSAIDMQSFITAANKNITQQTFTYSATLQSLSTDGSMRFKKTTANLAVYTALKVGNPITIKIGSTTYASGTVIGKTSNSRADRLEDEYEENHSEYQEPRETLYVIQLSSGAVTTEIGFNPTAVSIDITSTQDRFPFNGVIDTEETVFDNAKKILANMRGIFNYINGIYSLKIEDSEGVTLSISDDDILQSGIKVEVENKEQKYNIVEVEFANAQKDYELDTATYKHTSATTGQDYTYDDGGEELKLTIEMPYITNHNIVYQNAKAILLRSRNNKTISFTGTHKLLYAKVGELISITNSRLGMAGEQYRITKMTINNDLTVSVNAIIYQSNIYGYVTPPDENIEIPDDMVDSFKSDTPTNLNFVDKDPTTGVQPYLTWTNPTTYPAYEFRVIVKDSNNNVKYDGRTKNNFFNLTGIEVDNGYTAEVKSLNTNYVESQAATYNFNNSVPPVQNDDLGAGSVTDAKVADISADKIDTGVLNLGSEPGMAVRQTKTSYSSTATGFWLGNDGGTPKFNIGTSTNYLQFDGSNLQISGNISATTGTIGGFTVGDNYLRAGTGTTRISLSTVDGIHLGNNTFASAPFKVALNGDLTASSATIDGDITATTLTVEEANIQSLKLTLGGGILQDGSNNDLTVLNVINPDFPVDGLLHYFPLNGFSDPNDTTPADVIDVVSDVTGVITGSNGSFTTDSPNGQSYVNGATTGITLLSDAQADTWQSTTGDYTVALWFKSTTESGGAAARIIGRDASDFWSLALNQSETGNQKVTLFTDAESVSWDGASANEWHHVAMVVNSTTSAKLYVDGVLRATDTNINFTTEPRPVVLGCNTESSINTASNVFLGKFSDVRFYTKAITDKQVQSLYMNPAGGLPAKIEGDLFVTNTITADKLDVNTLDSISANLGSITAGDIDIGGGDFTVSATGVMTATGATISGNVTTTTLVVTEDADVIGNLKATSLASNIVKIGNLHQEVWNEIDARTATTQNGFYDEFTSAGGVGYIGVEKNFELLGSGSNGYLVNANNITLRGGSVSIVGSSTTQFTGTALQFTAQYQYKLTSGSTWTNTGSSVTATADVAESGGIYYYEVDADPDAQITGLTAGSYYQFRLKITPVVTNNVFRVSPTGAADSNGITIIFEAQQSSTSTGTGAGTVTSVTAGDGLSGGTITSSGTLAVDSTVVRTTGTQSIAGDKTFNNDIIIQGNLDVQGTTTTVNTDDLNVKDKNITLNYSTGDSSASANGAGITIQDAVSATQDATLTWNTSTDRFNFSHGLDFPASTLLVFGDNDDLRIQHNNANAVFSNFAGNIDFKNFADDSDIRFWSDDGAGGSAVYFKLDGSEGRSVASKDIRFEDGIKSTYGNSDDLQIYHDGNNSRVEDTGTGGLRLIGGNFVSLQSTSGENMVVATENGAVTLYHNNSPKLATTSSGISVTGTAAADNLHINSTSGQLKISRVGSSDNGIYWDRLGTQDAAIQVASNEQLNIDNNFGNPINLRIGADGSETTYLSVNTTGIDVTGTVTSDGLTVEGDAKINDTDATPLVIQRNGGTDANTSIHYQQSTYNTYVGTGNSGTFVVGNNADLGSSRRFAIEQNNDIFFYDDTGTAKLFWDASAEALRVGGTSAVNLGDTTGNGIQLYSTGINLKRTCTSSTQGLLHLNNIGTAGNVIELYLNGVQTGAIGVNSGAALTFAAGTGSSEKMRIDSSGNLLVGTTTAPNTLLGASSTQGVAFNGGQGYLVASASGQSTAYFNRQTSDGTIAEFRKDGTTVGSIGTQSARLTIGTGDTGLRFVADANQITPWNLTTNGVSNGLLDLGNTNNKFKDLYLSGETKFYEDSANGTNYVAIKSPSSLGVNTTYQLPSTYPANSGAVLIATTAGELSWSSNTVSSYTNGATGSGRIITSNGASSIEAETNLTYDNTTLKIANAGAVLEIGNATDAQPIIRLKTNSNGVPRIVFNDGTDQAYIQYGHGSLNGEKLTISSGATEFTGDIILASTPRIRADSAINFLTTGGSAQTGKFKSVAAQTDYSNYASDGMFNALNGYAVGTGTGTTVIDDSRNIINANSITLDDNKKLYFGTDDDSEISFTGTQTILRSPNTAICGSSNVSLATGVGVGQQIYLNANYSDGIKLYHEGSLKAQTQDDGFKVTGEIRGTQFAYSYYNSTSTTLTTSYAVINLDTLQASTGISGIAVASNVVTISRSGTFMITMDVVTDVTSGAGRTESEAQLYKNGSGVTGTFVGMYNRTVNRGLSTGSATTMISVTSGDTFEIRAKKTGNDTVVTSVGGTRLTFLQVG